MRHSNVRHRVNKFRHCSERESGSSGAVRVSPATGSVIEKIFEQLAVLLLLWCVALINVGTASTSEQNRLMLISIFRTVH